MYEYICNSAVIIFIAKTYNSSVDIIESAEKDSLTRWIIFWRRLNIKKYIKYAGFQKILLRNKTEIFFLLFLKFLTNFQITHFRDPNADILPWKRLYIVAYEPENSFRKAPLNVVLLAGKEIMRIFL